MASPIKTETTTLLAEAMDYIKNRHNYGKQKRMEIRQKLLLKYAEMKDGR